MPEVLEEFRGKRVLVVENQHVLTQEVGEQLQSSSAAVVGPVASVDQALSLVDEHEIDVAIIDVMMDGEIAFAITNALEAHGIPFVFASATEPEDAGDHYCGHVLKRPATMQAIAQKLFGERPH
jgi:CheY-like chemotaxis protein